MSLSLLNMTSFQFVILSESFVAVSTLTLCRYRHGSKCGKEVLAWICSPPLHIVPLPFTLPPLHSLPFPIRPSPKQLGGLGERCKLHQLGLGQSFCHKCVYDILSPENTFSANETVSMAGSRHGDVVAGSQSSWRCGGMVCHSGSLQALVVVMVSIV